ncbi:unnamed protein product [Ostreobium quekettii]|uniref:Major facilitator superfamily (MFS) profile domain-containing protein n=1 Tax=Ostreobium quekettii TaxID=121088 RepID=A0A8S1J5A2_9CHLO|nr:unnamed protein product [Ostreobium quekettii]
MEARLRTTLVINLTAIFEWADLVILPAMYDNVSRAFDDASPRQMGQLSTARGVVQALSSPIGGALGHFNDRISIIVAGCVIWGVMTMVFGTLSSLALATLVWSLNGFGQSLVIPNSQSIIADYYPAKARGRAFGTIYFTQSVGEILGSLYAVSLGSRQVGPVDGWRFVMFTFAIFSALTAFANWAFARDPRAFASPPGREGVEMGEIGETTVDETPIDEGDGESNKDADDGVGGKVEEDSREGGKDGENGPARAARVRSEELLGMFWSVLKIPTFCIIILQGVVGSMPWKGLMGFFILYFQLMGMTDVQAWQAYSAFLVGTAFGGLLGGWVGDAAAKISPDHGRILACQFSVLSGLPLTAILFRWMPSNAAPATVAGYVLICFVYGLLISWAAPACNNPIFAEIVPAERRSVIYAFDRCLENAIASLANMWVGAASEVYGFQGGASRSGDPQKDAENSRALGMAMLVFSVVPWSLCFLFYMGLHYTYPRDKSRVASRYTALAAS